MTPATIGAAGRRRVRIAWARVRTNGTDPTSTATAAGSAWLTAHDSNVVQRLSCRGQQEQPDPILAPCGPINRAIQPVSQWSAFGHDLLVSIDEVPRGRWGSHLCDQIRDGVRKGSLHPGVRLPATRALAHDLGLSRGVASGVYDQLKTEGYLTARPGSGTIVAESLDIACAPPATAPTTTRQRPSPGLSRPDLFPRREWLKAYRTVVEHLLTMACATPIPRVTPRFARP